MLNAITERDSSGKLISTPKSLIVVPSQDLVKQTYNRIERLYPDINIGQYYADKKDIKDVTIITYESLKDILKINDSPNGLITPSDLDFVVFDEAHRGISEQRSIVASHLIQEAICIGFTASPEYQIIDKTLLNHQDMRDIRAVWTLLGGEIDGIKIEDLVKSGHLSEIANIVIKINDNPDLDGEQKELFRRRIKALSALDLYMNYHDPEEPDKDKKTLLGRQGLEFTDDINHAIDNATLFNTSEELKSALESIGIQAISPPDNLTDMTEEECKSYFESFEKNEKIPAIAVSGKIENKTRDVIYKAYRDGKILNLASSDLLIEGIDFPMAEFAFNESATKSLVRALQRGGRVIRTDKNNPKKIARIFDMFIDGEKNEEQIFYHQAIGAVRLSREYSPELHNPIHQDQNELLDTSPITAPIGTENSISQQYTVHHTIEDIQRIRKSTHGTSYKNESGMLNFDEAYRYAAHDGRNYDKTSDIKGAVTQLFKAIEEAINKDANQNELLYNGTTISYSYSPDLNRGKKVPLVSQKSLDKLGLFHATIDGTPAEHPEYLSMNDLISMPGNSQKTSNHTTFKAFFDQCESAYNNSRMAESIIPETLQVNGQNIRYKFLAGDKQKLKICLHRDHLLPYISANYKTSAEYPEFISESSFARVSGHPSRNKKLIEGMYAHCLQKIDRTNPEPQAIDWNGHKIICVMLSNQKACLHIHKSHTDIFAPHQASDINSNDYKIITDCLNHLKISHGSALGGRISEMFNNAQKEAPSNEESGCVKIDDHKIRYWRDRHLFKLLLRGYDG